MMSKSDIDRLIDEVGLSEATRLSKVAAILFTYRCSIACKHCLFGCAADRPEVVMTPRLCADSLAMLHETNRIVHIAGGEAMMYWETLAEALRLAHADRCEPHFVETNCSFAANDNIVRERFTYMADHGVKGLYASADPFHQEFVSPERYLRVRRIAKEVFGENKFSGPEGDEQTIRELAEIHGDEDRLREYVRKNTPNMMGTAHKALSRFLDTHAPDSPDLPAKGWPGAGDEKDCLAQFKADSMWELHIDPYGNIQTNCGMILGSVEETTPARVLAERPETVNRFVEVVCEGGPLALAELAAKEYGFTWPESVTQGCELCYLARCHLRQFHPEVFGPAEVYG